MWMAGQADMLALFWVQLSRQHKWVASPIFLAEGMALAQAGKGLPICFFYQKQFFLPKIAHQQHMLVLMMRSTGIPDEMM
jgi:hypothetical protein